MELGRGANDTEAAVAGSGLAIMNSPCKSGYRTWCDLALELAAEFLANAEKQRAIGLNSVKVILSGAASQKL